MQKPGWLALAVVIGVAILVPLLVSDLMLHSLEKMGLAPGVGALIVLGFFLGSLVNIPLGKVPRDHDFTCEGPTGVFGIGIWRPEEEHRFEPIHHTILAVNLGGCVIPVGLAIYELILLVWDGPDDLIPLTLVTTLNVLVCYRMARQVEGMGFAIPFLVPPLVAAAGAYLLVPNNAPPFAFIAGTLGPLIGVDILHIQHVTRMNVAVASIGGAGTFDAIVLSGTIAALLA